ncbi:MAG: tRNA pseudouridine(38-40) synthase TruA [Bacteroidota bacterium]
MKRFFLHLSYDGTKYRGWQSQTGVTSVQEIVERELSKVLKKETSIMGCGRTDARVHASQYFAHFKSDFDDEFDLIFRLNKNLPDDISIHELIPVTGKNHARYHANSRTYNYFLHTKKVAHLATHSTLYQKEKLDFPLMKEAVHLIPKYNDFAAFCKTPAVVDSTECSIQKVGFYTNKDQTQFCFEISANRFLRGMIRNLMARIIQVGNGEISIGEFEEYLSLKRNEQLPIAAHPQGLYLSKIVYPFLDIEPVVDPKSVILTKKDDCWMDQV